MNIGKLRHRIEIQSYSTSADDVGQPIKSWSTDMTVWAWVRPMSGREKMNVGQAVGEITHKITIRYNDSIAVINRIKFGSRYFDINFIGNYDERNVFMEIMATEAV